MIKKDIVRYLINFYYDTLLLFFTSAVITAALYIYYRLSVYILIKSIYTDIRLDYINYLYISFHYDCVTLLFSLLILIIILFITKRSLFARYIITSIFLLIQLFLILAAIEFFRVYETSFQLSFWGKESSSGLRELLYSAFAESSISFYFSFLIFSAAIIIIFIFLRKCDNHKIISEFISSEKNILLKKMFIYSPLFFVSILFISAVLTGSELRYNLLAEKINPESVKRLSSSLHELSMNPVYNLFVKDKANFNTEAFINEEDSKYFSFRYKFNTGSLVSNRRFPRLNIIPRGKKYNIILYFFESTPSKYVNIKINGKYVVKSLQRLSKNSFIAKNHYANFPLSANSLLNVLTSSYDHHKKELVIQKYPDIKLKSAPEILKANGYRTCLIHTGDLGYAGQRGFLKNRKFDRIIEYKHLKKTPPYNYHVGWGLDERAMIKPTVDFIMEKPDEPFFIIYLPVNPHHPYKIPDKKFRITGKIPEGLNYKRVNWLNYLNSLHYSDAVLGMLIDRLEKEGALDNTLVFIFADHGEAFYQHRKNYNHPFFLYEENVNVPFIIYNKNLLKKPYYYEGISRHIDILPSIMDILGLPGINKQEGISIFSAHREQLALLHTFWKDDFIGIRDGRWKYINRMKDQLEELYDLSKDPNEKKNLALKRKDIIQMYREYILKSRRYIINYYKRILKVDNNK